MNVVGGVQVLAPATMHQLSIQISVAGEPRPHTYLVGVVDRQAALGGHRR